MRSGNDDTARCFQFTNGIGKARCRFKFVININLNSVSRQNLGRLPAEIIALNSGVISDCDRRRVIIIIQVIGKSLSCSADGIHIHSVCTGTDYSSESCRTEFERTIKSVQNFIVIFLNIFEFNLKVGVCICFFKPFIIQRINIHKNSSAKYCCL